MKNKTKATFTNTASDNNGGIQVNIPPKIAEHNDIEPGDQIAFQTEYSEKHGGPYASLWNADKHDDSRDNK